MVNTMKKWTLLMTTLLLLSTSILYAQEKLASVLRGKIIASNLSEIEVFIKESDGSILDMTDATATGAFSLDLTIMDIPSLAEVQKLTLEVKSKSGFKKSFSVNKYLNDFNDTVVLNPIILK